MIYNPPDLSMVQTSLKVNEMEGFPCGTMVNNLAAKQDTWFWSLSQEDSLEKEMATQSTILARIISWTEEPGGLQSMGSQESDMTERLNRRHIYWAFIYYVWGIVIKHFIVCTSQTIFPAPVRNRKSTVTLQILPIGKQVQGWSISCPRKKEQQQRGKQAGVCRPQCLPA